MRREWCGVGYRGDERRLEGEFEVGHLEREKRKKTLSSYRYDYRPVVVGRGGSRISLTAHSDHCLLLTDDESRPQATCLAAHPRDLNIMLIGYEGGVVAWDMQNSVVAKTYEMSLPPGESRR